MNHPEVAAFSLKAYRFSEFHFREPNSENISLSINMSPSGVYSAIDRMYLLMLEFTATLKNPDETLNIEPVVSLRMESAFEISETGELPTYFYANALAIVFPFLRAFVSTLTLQAGSTQLILPIANLTKLAVKLQEQTEFMNESFQDENEATT